MERKWKCPWCGNKEIKLRPRLREWHCDKCGGVFPDHGEAWVGEEKPETKGEIHGEVVR